MTVINECIGGGQSLLKAFKNVPRGNWKLKTTVNGDTFPGFGTNVIPLCLASVSVSASASKKAADYEDKSVTVTRTVANEIYASATGGRGGTENTDTRVSMSATAYNIFLPLVYDFDLTKVQSSVTSGTINVWLEK